ncbi:PP2C family serine/threonine-protein phosphatase [Methanolacinia paynteri]|uniref:PP2C family serine/threonine-protein phosphatase n=1 Tax=Methanolacinia paynteri TaxID=230356 RepID=UPI00064ED049|nr:PP2C family serine/threonine-protein phosphatase [Methanolacinia paynteri]
MPVFGGKTTGSSHIKKGVPCQDAFRSEKTDSGEIIVAVADGLGSAEHSEIGAKIAVNTAVDKIKSLFTNSDYGIPDASLMKNRDIITEAFSASRTALEDFAGDNGYPLKKLACTLIVAFTWERYLTTGHIGDGAVTALIQDEIRIISDPGNSEYVNEVTPLTSGKIEDNIRINENIPYVSVFAAFTDGCQRAFLVRKNGEYLPYEPFFRPIFTYAKDVADEEEASKEIVRFLESDKMNENSDDDKTLVIAVAEKREDRPV